MHTNKHHPLHLTVSSEEIPHMVMADMRGSTCTLVSYENYSKTVKPKLGLHQEWLNQELREQALDFGGVFTFSPVDSKVKQASEH